MLTGNSGPEDVMFKISGDARDYIARHSGAVTIEMRFEPAMGG